MERAAKRATSRSGHVIVRGSARAAQQPIPLAAILVSNMASAEINMASSDIITEVEIQPDIQEVEIETIPVDIPCETVETTIEGDDGQPMIALQALPEPGREEIILQPQEEIVGGDPLGVYDQIPVPESEIYVESSPGPSRRVQTKKSKKPGAARFRTQDHAIFGDMATDMKARKWEQKQVQIKTLEGEFSVTMWASGTDDGTSNLRLSSFFSLLLSLSLFLFSFFLLSFVPSNLPVCPVFFSSFFYPIVSVPCNVFSLYYQHTSLFIT